MVKSDGHHQCSIRLAVRIPGFHSGEESSILSWSTKPHNIMVVCHFDSVKDVVRFHMGLFAAVKHVGHAQVIWNLQKQHGLFLGS